MLLMKRWWRFMRLIMNLHEDINLTLTFSIWRCSE